MDRQEAARANTRTLRSEGACRMMLIEQKSSALVLHAFARVLQRRRGTCFHGTYAMLMH
jgi:hypothetical protein